MTKEQLNLIICQSGLNIYVPLTDLQKLAYAILAEAASNPLDREDSFQSRVEPRLMDCFGPMIAGDREERNHRFFEEAGELVQACGMGASEAHQLVDYVWNRPVGEKIQEIGGVMVTLAALCLANDLDMHAAAETELARIWTKVEAIRTKQAAKPKHSPLPIATPPERSASTREYPETLYTKGQAEWCRKYEAETGFEPMVDDYESGEKTFSQIARFNLDWYEDHSSDALLRISSSLDDLEKDPDQQTRDRHAPNIE